MFRRNIVPVVLVVVTIYFAGANRLNGYIPVTYPTGLLWNPYPSMLATTNLWPKGFPDILKQGPGEEVLNPAMEMVPVSSIGPIQFLPHPNHENTSMPRVLALGLKTFAHMTEADTLFTSSSLWSLFLPNHNLSSVYRGLLSQPLLWRLGLHTAFVRSVLPTFDTADNLPHQDELDLDLLHAVLKTNLTACVTLPDCFRLIYSQNLRSGKSNIVQHFQFSRFFVIFQYSLNAVHF